MIQRILAIILEYGYWALFFGVALENAGLPIPGETMLLAAGFFAARGHFNIVTVVGVALLGAVLGDNTGYLVGRRIGRAALVKYGHYVFLTSARLERLDSFFAKYGAKTIFIARFVTGLRVFAALFAGAAHMPWPSFFTYNVAGAILWSITISLVGYFFGDNLELLESWFRRGGVFLLLLFVLLLLLRWAYVRKHRTKSVTQSVEGDSSL